MRKIRQLTTELTFRCNAKCPACHRIKPLRINLNDKKYTISLERFKQLFNSESFDVFNKCYYCEYDNRSGVGFDKPQIEGNHGSTFGGVSMNSFGHYGYTGSMAWADPDEEIIFVFLHFQKWQH